MMCWWLYQVHRVNKPGRNENKVGRWVLREEAIKGLSPNQIKVKYSLPEMPTHISDVKPIEGTRILRGRVKENFGGKSGAVQYEIMEDLRKNESWFTNTRELK